MKKSIKVMLIGALCLSMLPLSFLTANAATPTIKVDGDLSDWKDVATIKVEGSDANAGKKATFYGLLTDAGVYLACDAYHATYTTTEGEWHRNTNFEFFVNVGGEFNSRQAWVSAKGMGADKTTPDKSDEGFEAVMKTIETDSEATPYHTMTEVFLPATLDFVAAGIADGTIRIGVAWKTPGDVINNGEANNGNNDEYWVPKGSWPNNENKTYITSDGIYLKADYEAAHKDDIPPFGAGSITEGENTGKWTAKGSTLTVAERTKWPNFSVYGLGNTTEKVTVSAKVTIAAKADEQGEIEKNNGGDSGILFAVADANKNKVIEEGADYYYLVGISCSEDGPFVGVERNAAGWGDWAKRSESLNLEKGATVTLSATYDPKTATITVSVDGKEVLTYTDETGSPLSGTGYALASKVTGATYTDVTVNGKAIGGSTGGDKPVKPAPTGSASVVIAAVAVISLAGVVVATKKREQD